jgi:hypothetical protein
MNDIASMRKTGPLEPWGLYGPALDFSTAPIGLAALETVGDFGDFFVEGKRKFYQEMSFAFRVPSSK